MFHWCWFLSIVAELIDRKRYVWQLQKLWYKFNWKCTRAAALLAAWLTFLSQNMRSGIIDQNPFDQCELWILAAKFKIKRCFSKIKYYKWIKSLLLTYFPSAIETEKISSAYKNLSKKGKESTHLSILIRPVFLLKIWVRESNYFVKLSFIHDDDCSQEIFTKSIKIIA